jgi:hypothetical protein
MAHEAAHVLAAYQGNVLAEFLPVEVDKAAAMLVLLGGHFREDLGGSRKAFGEDVRVLGIDAAVLFLERDGKRQDLPLAELGEIAQVRLPLGSCWLFSRIVLNYRSMRTPLARRK